MPDDVKVSPAEIKMAENLVGMMAMEFDPEQFKDDYKKALMEVVEAKIEKRQVIEAPEPEAETTVVDLMAALKASVEKAKKGETARGRESRGGHESLVARKKTSAREKSARKKAS
jgi:DNA end-binding protein Ku